MATAAPPVNAAAGVVFLSPPEWEQILARAEAGEMLKDLASEWGVHPATISRKRKETEGYRRSRATRPAARPARIIARRKARLVLEGGSQAGRTEDELVAATRLVQQLEARADSWEDEMPLWCGWSIHQAFLLGVEWARRHPEERER